MSEQPEMKYFSTRGGAEELSFEEVSAFSNQADLRPS